MQSTPRRRSELATALRTYSGEPLTIRSGSSAIPNFVAMKISLRLPDRLNLYDQSHKYSSQ